MRNSLGLKLLLALSPCIGVTGCEVGPDYHPPAEPMPGAFAAPLPRTPATHPTTAPSPAPPVDLARWWQALGDPELNSLIERAVVANPDIESALTRLQQARTQELVVLNGLLPQAALVGGAARGSGSDSTRGRVPSVLTSATNTKGLQQITEAGGLVGGVAFDLFGGQRRALEAAAADSQAAAEFRNVVLINVVSDVARAYLDARAFRERLEIARDNVRAQQQTMNFVQGRFNQGLTNELDVALAQRQLASAQAQVEPLQAALAASQAQVAVLLGKFPDELSEELNRPAAIPLPPEVIQPGLPIALLRRRPEIRLAERQLAAETARVGVATANLFPTVGINGVTGFQGQGLGISPSTAHSIWSLGPYAYWPVLDFGVLDALVTIQDFRAQDALINYKRIILQAVQEVNDAITSYSAQQDRLRNLDDAVNASQKAVSLATQRYERGLTDFLNVLDAQRQYYDLADQYAAARAQVAEQFIAIYKSLGGGWEGFKPGPPPPTPRPAIIAAFSRFASPPAPTLPVADPPPAPAVVPSPPAGR